MSFRITPSNIPGCGVGEWRLGARERVVGDDDQSIYSWREDGAFRLAGLRKLERSGWNRITRSGYGSQNAGGVR